MNLSTDQLYTQSVELLQLLITTPSFSREEDKTASILFKHLEKLGIQPHRKGNNVWALNKHFDIKKPTVLLNSHHDTVKPNPHYTHDPFAPDIIDGKLFGLGSNDAGGALVSLLATFIHFFERNDLSYNLIFSGTAEEEISGHQGIESILGELPEIDCAIVGEPTLNHIATAEKGLLVIECTSKGKAGHAAREEGLNAIYEALPDIEWFREYKFPKESNTLGQIKMSVTKIEAGQAHNQVPPECNFTVDIRVTDAYSLEEVLETVKKSVSCQVEPRSLRMRSSGIANDHPLVMAANQIGLTLYGSPTTSDQALIPKPSIKMGPGDSARSHSADEFIYCEEIRSGIAAYIELLEHLVLKK